MKKSEIKTINIIAILAVFCFFRCRKLYECGGTDDDRCMATDISVNNTSGDFIAIAGFHAGNHMDRICGRKKDKLQILRDLRDNADLVWRSSTGSFSYKLGDCTGISRACRCWRRFYCHAKLADH